MAKQKPLLPTLKEKKRYIVYQVHTDSKLSLGFSHALIDCLNTKLGVFDAACAGLQSIAYDSSTKRGVIRVTHTHTNKVRALLVLINKVLTDNIMIKPLITSGVLKKAKAAV